MEAYFKWVNNRKGPDGKKGIRGRQIVWKYYDDGYNPAQTRSADEQAGPRGQDLRGRRLARHGAQPGDPPDPERAEDPADPRVHGRELLGPPVQAVPVDDRLAARLHRRGPRLRRVDHEERAEREDRGLLPERRLRQGLPARPEDRSRREEEPDRLRAELRGDGHELRLADRAAEGVRSGHVGAADDADADGSRASRRPRR